jgi:hypothetical protein
MEKESDEFVKILERKLSQLKINMVSQKDTSDISDTSSNNESSNNESEIGDVDQLTAMFNNQDLNEAEINPIYTSKSLEKYYYKRPSPQDLLFEENEFYQNSYSGKSIYEWNIDGLNEKQIIDVIHRMIMYSTVCKQQGNRDGSIATFITTGFVGQLRGWWDHYLNETQRIEILTHKKLIKSEVLLVMTLALLPSQEKKMESTLCV